METEEKVNDVFSSHTERTRKLMELLPDTDDITLVTLKGHLIIEEALYAIVEDHCNYPKYIGEARLSFAQLTCLAKALINIPLHDPVFPAIEKLNKLRNNLAHNITSEKANLLANEFVQLCKQKSDSEKELVLNVKYSIGYILGALSVVGAASEMLKNMPNNSLVRDGLDPF